MERHRASGRAGLGFALAATTMALWGVLPLALEAALRLVDPLTLTWFRFLAATLLLAAWLAARGALPRLRGLGRGNWRLLAVATAGLAANYIAYVLGLERTTPANAQVLIQSAPLLLALGGVFVFRERFAPAQWLGLVAIVAGLAGFFASQLSIQRAALSIQGAALPIQGAAHDALGRDLDRYLAGVSWIGVAAVTWALYGLAQKQLLRVLSSQGVMLCIYAGCALAFWPGATPSQLASVSAAGAAVLAFCALNTLVAYGAFAAALEHWEASRVSAVLALTPLATLACSAAAAWLFPERAVPETLSPASWAGAAAVVAGSLLTSLGGRRAAIPAARAG